MAEVPQVKPINEAAEYTGNESAGENGKKTDKNAQSLVIFVNFAHAYFSL